MPIQRSGPTPFFHEYITGNALVPQKEEPSAEILLASPGFNIQWVDVPNYQRGIAWDISTIEELLESPSVLLGNIILGQFDVEEKEFKYLPDNVKHFVVLVDGLQRFSVGTALLACLYPLVLKSEPDKPELSSHFKVLAARVNTMAPVFLHNDRELRHHPRAAISDAYNSFKSEVQTYIESELEEEDVLAFAKKVCNLFLQKQIAIDLYFNFSSFIEIINTFIGINTVRVDLSPVDLLRSFIVEKAFNSKWSPSDIEIVENKITDVFTLREKPRGELLPFVAIILNQIRTPKCGTFVFPSWDSELKIEEVEDFLQFVSDFLDVADNPFLNEIRACGAIPVAGILSYYYNKFRHGTNGHPSFFSGKKEENPELYNYLRATYRQLINGTVGKARDSAEKLFKGVFENLSEVSDHLSLAFIKVSINKEVDEAWLKINLKRADQNRAKRVFNALYLPKLGAMSVEEFYPDKYGSKSKEYHIDHLIANSIIDENMEGALESQTLINFAPLPSSYNREAKATPCSAKINKQGIYGSYIDSNPKPHPYCKWLIEVQSLHGSFLDRQELLEPNSEPPMGSERLDWLSKELCEKI